MRKRQLGTIMISTLAVLAIFVGSTITASTATADGPYAGMGKIVVADRASGTITVISTETDEVLGTINLPAGDNEPEPMYVYSPPYGKRFFVGDRANDRVIAFNKRTCEAVGMAETGAGVFHMWGSPVTGELWVNCDLDNTTSVIDMTTLETVATVPTPADLVAMGGKPHDIFVSPEGFFAYLTVIGVEGDMDYVVQYDARTFEEIGRAAVGDDPHVSLTLRTPFLYVPAQGGNVVHVLDRFSMEPVTDIDAPGAHGAGMASSGRYFYTTNLPAEGIDALWTIDTMTNMVVGDPVDTPYAVPHNIALTPNGRKLYVTHSGESDKVTVYQTTGLDPVPEYLDEITVGMNPFGIAYVR